MNMFVGHISLLILIVLKLVHWLAYQNRRILTSYILDNLEGKHHFPAYSGDTVGLRSLISIY